VLDERIALRHGVLGQETTGPGGFAMALRSIPAILGYARLRDELCPNAWMFNFTNPAGLVAQALHDAGFARAVGICDSANGAQAAIAPRLGCAANDLRPEVFGLNHLSWTRRVMYRGEDVLPRLLADPEVLRETRLNIFEPALVRHLGMWLNEYLYYFYYAERAVAAISAEERTRGEEVLMLNRDLLAQLQQLDLARDFDAALAVYYRYERRRSSTYMHYAQQDAPTPEEADALFSTTFLEVDPHEGEGYAGVALDIMAALTTGEPHYTALNVPNAGAIAGMAADDVVEVSCVVDGDGVHPLPIGTIPDGPALLMQVIKRYERLTVRAVAERSRALAIDALMAHPLVLSYSRARALVDEYLAAHAPYVGEWA